MNETPAATEPTKIPAELAEALKKASPDLDVFAAVARGELTPRQAAAVLRSRARDARRLKPTRHFKSLFTEHHANRHERRATAKINRVRARANEKAAQAYYEKAWNRIAYTTEENFAEDYALDQELGFITVVEGVDDSVAAAWVTELFRALQAKPLPVRVPGIVFKAAWPADRAMRTKMKKAQREMYRKGEIGGRVAPMPVQSAAEVAS